MDGQAAIEHNRQALLRILLTLFAMAGVMLRPHPEVRTEGEPRRTLPRHLHRAILRLLRPAESAARRLIIALAAGIVTAPPQARKKHNPPLQARERQDLTPQADTTASRSPIGAPLRRLALPLLDSPPRHARRAINSRLLPRISLPGIVERLPVGQPPAGHDPIDAARLGLRLDALRSALDDLSRQAVRFARWRSRQDLARRAGLQATASRMRLWALRPGRPPGAHRRPDHEVQQVLDLAHRMARDALDRPLAHGDTS